MERGIALTKKVEDRKYYLFQTLRMDSGGEHYDSTDGEITGKIRELLDRT